MKLTLSIFTKNTAAPASEVARLLLLLSMLFWAAGNLFSQTTWTGSISTNWNTAGNWSAGIPDAGDDVTIPNVTNDPVISAAGALAKSVTVQSGGLLTLTAGGTLAINGASAQGLLNQGTVQNNGIIHIGNVSGTGANGIANEGVFNNNTGAQLNIDRSTSQALANRSNGVFTNQAILNIGGLAAVGSSGINNFYPAIFNKTIQGQITIDRCWSTCLSLHDGTFNNSGSIVLAPLNGSNDAINVGIGIIYGTFNNNTGGQISIERCREAGVQLSYPQCSFSNAGAVTINTPSIQEHLIKSGSDNGTFTNHSGGVVKGTGNINGVAFVNAGGTLVPGYSPGKIDFTASENFANNTLPVEVNGTGTPGVNFDQITVNGTATLGGTLALSINYTPSNGDEVTIVSATAIVGTFSTVTGLPAGWSLYYAGDRVVLIYGANSWTGSVSTNWSTPGNWSQGVVPGANHPVIIPNVTNDPVVSTAGAVARSIWVQSGGLLTISTAGTLAINGSTTQGFLNQGTVQNNGALHVGNTSNAGANGIVNGGIFNNNTGAQIHIDRCSNAGVYTYAGAFNNAGVVTIGALSAMTNLLSGTGVAGTFSNNAGGLVKGTGNIESFHFVHAGGTLSPGYSPGKMTFAGNENFSNSTLVLEVNATGTPGVNFDQIVVNGTATLGGTLALSVNFAGATGDGIILISATAISGTFSSVTGIPANWQVNYSSTEVTLTYSAAGASTWTGAVSTAWNTAGNWSAGVPGTSTIVTIPNVANDPVISTAGAAARSVTVQSGGVLTLTATGTLAINGAVDNGLLNQGTVQNNGVINIGNVSVAGDHGLVNESVFNNNTGAQINIDRSNNQGLVNRSNGVFTNHAILNIGGLAAVGSFGINNYSTAIFNNNTGGQITIDRCWSICLSLHEGTFNNSGSIVLAPLNGSNAQINDGIVIIYGNFNNNTGGQISVERCREAGVKLSYPQCSFSNAGTFTVNTPNIQEHLIKSESNNGTFTNQTGGVVKGTGNINGVVFVNAGGTLSPGYSPGKMTFTASENFSNGTMIIEVNGTGTAGTHYDQVVVNGTATLGGPLTLSINHIPTANAEISIVSATAVTSTFSSVTGLLANWSISYTSNSVKLSYQAPLSTWYRDMDNDGFGNPAVTTQATSQPAGYVANNTDCDDNDALEKPGQVWYKDTDGDGYGQTGAATITQCLRPTGYKAASELIATTGDCNDTNGAIKPGATEVCDGVDNNCNGSTDEGVLTTYYRDLDGDTYGNSAVAQQACSQPMGYVDNSLDCNDNNALERPGQVWYKDTDGDGYGQTGASSITQCLRPMGYKTFLELISTTGDCNDTNAAINPDATEVCDGVDNDCDNQIDENGMTTWYRDQDNDGFGNPAVTQTACTQPTGYVANNTDCDDNDVLEKPGQVWYKDTDSDGYGQTGAATIMQCLRPTGYKVASELIATTGDCNDNNAAINPAATEICDGVDNDCDNNIDEGVQTTYYRDQDNDGFGNPAVTQTGCSQPTGYVANNTDCDDNDALEKPGQVWYKDADGDDYSDGTTLTQCLRPANYYVASELIATSGDCNDSAAAINPAAAEVCDGIDNNCNGSIDEGGITYYRDLDGDGFGNPGVTQFACTAPSGYVTNNTDCNDNSALEKPGQVWYKDADNDGYGQTGAASITQCLRPAGYKAASELTATTGDCNDDPATGGMTNPDATEICDGVDNDCDSQIDEGVQTTYYRDQDGDGYGNPAITQAACTQPTGYVTNNTDCDDNDALEKPGQVWYADADNDGYSSGATQTQCLRPTGYKVAAELTSTTGDCNDIAAAINPAATEICDGVDNDCDSQIDEGVKTTYYRDMDGDGFGNPAVTQASCTQPIGYVANNTDCDDNDALEKPGQVWYKDADNDGYAETGAAPLTQCLRPTSYKVAAELTSTTGDCDDNPATGATTNPAASEICDGTDNNCNSEVDEATAIGGSWTNGDVGTSGANGSAENACGTANSNIVNVAASGFSTSSSDNLHLVYQTLCGNGEIIARVVNVSNGGWAGITLRESLAPGSKKVGLKTQGMNTIRREIRSMTNAPVNILNVNRPQHLWLRLVRNGNNFTGYTSVNGSTWDFAFTANVTMTGCIYAGLFAESINNNVETATSFGNVSIIGGTTPALSSQVQNFTPASDALEVSVYPNPSSGEMTLAVQSPKVHPLTLTVMDALGRIVRNIELAEGINLSYPLDLSSEPAGIYYLHLRSKEGLEQVQRIVLQN